MASHPTQPNEQRRRLLKAASAAPVIFTLPVGSSVAAGSVYCADPDMGNTITVSGEYNVGQTVTIENQEYYVEYKRDDGDYDLITSSCWSSLNPSASAGSSTHIV